MATKAYALRIKPELSPGDAKKAENQLNSRFKKVADKYGDEMQKQNTKVSDGFSHKMTGAFTALKSKWALVAGAAAAVAGAILSNPIDEANQKLDDYLKRIDNLQTRARQWDVAPEKYLIASEIAGTAGAGEFFDQALLRIAERLEKAQTGEDPTLKQFLGANDIVDAFFQLSQTWAQMNPQARAASMADILGARQANQFAELIDTDWLQRAQQILQAGGVRYSELGPAIRHGAELEEQQSIGRSGLRLQEYARLARETSSKTIEKQMLLESIKQREALDDIKQYQRLAGAEITRIEGLANTVDEIKDGVLDLVNMVGTELGFNGDENKAKQRAEIKAIVQTGIKSAVVDLAQPKTTPRQSGVASAINTLWGGGV